MEVTRIKRILYVCGACGLVYSSPEKTAFNQLCPDCSSGNIINLTNHNGKLLRSWGMAYSKSCAGLIGEPEPEKRV